MNIAFRLLEKGTLRFIGLGSKTLSSFGCKIPIATHDQLLAREHVGGRDFSQIPLVE
jgi:hypothetical protein